MRILVLGTSSSFGTTLTDRALAWPNVIGSELAAHLGEPVEVEHRAIFPMGSKAVALAMDAVDETRPDMVIFSFGSFPCAIATVGTRVKRRYGPRAHALFRRFETRFEGATGNARGKPARFNTWGRRLARRVIGADPLTSYEEVAAIQTETLHRLASREGLSVVVYGEPSFGAGVTGDNPRANRILHRLRGEIETVARRHHFLVVSCEAAYAAHPRRATLHHSDGVHKTVEGHRVQAAEMMRALLANPEFLPSATAPTAPAAPSHS